MLGQLFCRQRRAEVGVSLAHNRQCQGLNLSREPMVAGFATTLGEQARSTILLQATQQAKYLTAMQADQLAGVGNTKTARLNTQQHLKPTELLLAHRHHRHGASSATPKPGGVSPLLCTGVSSLYCADTVNGA